MKAENTESKQYSQSNYSVIAVGIKWSNKTIAQYYTKHDRYVDLPSQFTLDIPENVLSQASKKANDFNDVIESFVYNFLTRKFGHEVNRCQIWLPLEA